MEVLFVLRPVRPTEREESAPENIRYSQFPRGGGTVVPPGRTGSSSVGQEAEGVRGRRGQEPFLRPPGKAGSGLG